MLQLTECEGSVKVISRDNARAESLSEQGSRSSFQAVLGWGWRAKNSWLRKGLAHLSVSAVNIRLSPNNDIPHASGLKKTQGGGESRQKQ